MTPATWRDLHGHPGDDDPELEEAADALRCIPCPECGDELTAARWKDGGIYATCCECYFEDEWNGHGWPALEARRAAQGVEAQQ